MSARAITHDRRGWPHLNCPKRHAMWWLGSRFWICESCHVIYVSSEATAIKR